MGNTGKYEDYLSMFDSMLILFKQGCEWFIVSVKSESKYMFIWNFVQEVSVGGEMWDFHGHQVHHLLSKNSYIFSTY